MVYADRMQGLTSCLMDYYTAMGMETVSDTLYAIRDSKAWNAYIANNLTLCGEMVMEELQDWRIDAWLGHNGVYSDIGEAFKRMIDQLEA